MNVIAERRRRRPGELGVHEPERKRVCRSSETFPQVINACYPLRKYAMDYWDMEQDLKQKDPTDFFSPQIMKEKPNSMIFPDNETRTTAQPCSRCIAGEPIHSLTIDPSTVDFYPDSVTAILMVHRWRPMLRDTLAILWGL